MKNLLNILLILVIVVTSGIKANADNYIDGRFIKNRQIANFITEKTLESKVYNRRFKDTDYVMDKSRIVFTPIINERDQVKEITLRVPILNVCEKGRIEYEALATLKLKKRYKIDNLLKLLRYEFEFKSDNFKYEFKEIGGGYPRDFPDPPRDFTELSNITEDRYLILKRCEEDEIYQMEGDEIQAIEQIIEHSIDFRKTRLFEIVPGEKIFIEVW